MLFCLNFKSWNKDQKIITINVEKIGWCLNKLRGEIIDIEVIKRIDEVIDQIWSFVKFYF